MPLVLITGCSSGIGRALADAYKHAGYEVWATARKTADVAQLKADGFVAVQLDVNDSLDVDRLSKRIKQHGQGLDVLINNAGYGAMGPVLDGGVEALQLQFETNVFSIVGMTQSLLEPLRSNRGLVVNIGSVSGVLVTPFAGAYCASKAAVHALSEAMRNGLPILASALGSLPERLAGRPLRAGAQMHADEKVHAVIRNDSRHDLVACAGRQRCHENHRIKRVMHILTAEEIQPFCLHILFESIRFQILMPNPLRERSHIICHKKPPRSVNSLSITSIIQDTEEIAKRA